MVKLLPDGTPATVMYLLTDFFRYLPVILVLPNHGIQKGQEIFFKGRREEILKCRVYS